IMLAILLPIIGFQQIAFDFAFARALPRVWNGEPRPPLAANVLTNLQSNINMLASALRSQGADMGKRPELNAWAVAQIWLALDGRDHDVNNGGDRLRVFMRSARDSSCRCWRETEDKPAHSLATAWVLYALAHYGQPATYEEIEEVLKRQGEAGWGALLPALADARKCFT